MVFAISDGQMRGVHAPTYQAPSALRINDDFSQDYAEIYRAQGSVRVVVDFLARNIAQLALHTFQRVGDNDRERLRDHPVARLFSAPNAYTTPYRLWRDLISDLGIYDRALWVKATSGGKDELRRIPPRLWSIADGDSWLAPTVFLIKGNRGQLALPADRAVYFRGYNPLDERHGMSPIESLRRALAEEYAASTMREQTLRNGARVSGYLKRPQGSEWSTAARNRFAMAWRQQYSGWSATEGGGTPILEDGMEFVPASHNAVDLQYIESRKLTREEVAAAYFIPPPMVGILDKATFSNISEQHKMLYQDTLGPRLRELQDEITLQIINADYAEQSAAVYVEFNLEEKLRGSFEEQAARLQTSVGAPYMTRNEARARMNLSRIDGGDELITPLNVLEGRQASPTDSAPPPKRRSAGVQVKSRASDADQKRIRTAMRAFFARQAQAVLSAIGASEDAWWNEKRWNDELADELLGVAVMLTSAVGRSQLRRMGLDPDDYDQDRTQAWLETVTRSNAGSINAATRIRLEAILDDDEVEDPLSEATRVFEVAESSRSAQVAATMATSLAGFASVEAVRQVSGEKRATKTWIVTSSNPRESHAAMNGETVALDDTFSNGAKWPGDTSALDVDEVAGCTCDVEITIE